MSKVHNVIVYSFRILDAEDPGMFVAEPILYWEQSACGKWVMEHALEKPLWYTRIEHSGYMCEIHAKLTDQDYTFWKLKYE